MTSEEYRCLSELYSDHARRKFLSNATKKVIFSNSGTNADVSSTALISQSHTNDIKPVQSRFTSFVKHVAAPLTLTHTVREVRLSKYSAPPNFRSHQHYGNSSKR